MAASQPARNACRVSSGHKVDPEAVGDVMHHYPFHASDYMMSTAHLTLEEDATYRRLLDFYYTTELPIPTDNRAVSRRLRVDEKITASVLAEFFVPQDDGWHNERCDAEIAAYHAMKERNALNGKLGGRPLKTDRLPRANRGVSQNNPLVTDSKANQEPITNNHISPLPPLGAALFERFWTSYPNKKNKKAAERAWKKLKIVENDERIPAMREGLASWKTSDEWAKEGGQFIPHASSWLNGERWNDELPKPHTGLVI